MEEILNNILNTYLVPALMTFISGFIAWIGTKIKTKYDENPLYYQDMIMNYREE